ncbi:hypothetical protein EXIGLDRAFT_737460 [Exidia glandulosa HHB12029]|uniref:Uncharacterized protein n=1 Tax=Exidia glandulosa HHB12029 TaxID=1314781 RepID=A0A166MXV4_EXIGL|nr:hypothetical protein EXIGLDRAFT_737460 [Exidia glandulosa HHB12029]
MATVLVARSIGLLCSSVPRRSRIIAHRRLGLVSFFRIGAFFGRHVAAKTPRGSAPHARPIHVSHVVGADGRRGYRATAC